MYNNSILMDETGRIIDRIAAADAEELRRIAEIFDMVEKLSPDELLGITVVGAYGRVP